MAQLSRDQGKQAECCPKERALEPVILVLNPSSSRVSRIALSISDAVAVRTAAAERV